MSSQYSPEEAKLASDATNEFYKGQMDTCLVKMRKLLVTKPLDPKVLSNKALIEFIHRYKFTRSDDFASQLQHADSLSGSSVLMEDAHSNHSENISECKQSNDSQTTAPVVFSIHYNYALVLFHQRQYHQSERILARLLGVKEHAMGDSFQFPIAVTDSLLCQRTVLLWLEVCLCLQRPQRVFEATSTWLSQLVMSSPGQLSKSPDSGEPVFLELGEHIIVMLAGVMRPLHVFRLRAAVLTGRLTVAAESAKAAGNEVEEGGIESSQQTKEATGHWDVERSLNFARAQLVYLQDSHVEAADHLFNISSSNSEAGRWESTLIDNNLSLVHFRAGKFALSGLKIRRALRTTDKIASELSQSASHAPPPSPSGGGNKQRGSQVPRIPLFTCSTSRHYALLHNSGIQLLFAQKPAAAFNALLPVLAANPHNPRLWLRLAECSIKVQKPDNLSDWKLESRANCLKASVGSGRARKLVIGANNQVPSKPWIESASMPTPTLEFAALCLRNALFLLPRPPTQFTGLDAQGDNSVERQRAALIKWASQQSVSALPSSAPIHGLSLLHITSSVLLTSAYVALCLNNAVETIHFAEQILRNGPPPVMSTDHSDENTEAACLPALFGWIGLIAPPAHRYLAKMYLAEAHVSIDELPDACGSLLAEDFVGMGESLSLLSLHSIDSYAVLQRGRASLSPAYLLPQTHPHCALQASSTKAPVGGYTAENSHVISILPGQSANRQADFPVTAEQAIGVLLYNLGVCCAVRGDYSVSRQLLENAAPALLARANISWDPRQPLSMEHSSEEHHNLLYPNPNAHVPVSSILHLPTHFLRLWIYLDRVCEDRLPAALNFVHTHLGHVANSGGRLMTTRASPPPTNTPGGTGGEVVFEIGMEGCGEDVMYGRGEERFAAILQQQHAAAVRRLKQSHSVPLLIQDPPPQQPKETMTWTGTAITNNDAEWPPL